MKRKHKQSIIPGFYPAFGITTLALCLIVLLPLSSLLWKLSGLTLRDFFRILTEKQTLEAFAVSLKCAFYAALCNLVFGVILAWVLCRYDFFLKKLIDGLIELPFALPTAVAGITLTSLYSENGMLGGLFANFGIKISYTRIGIVVAMVFTGLPFVVRNIQPVLEKFDRRYEEAGMMLGAGPGVIFGRIILPHILPAAISGFGLAFARSLGEYGSVVFIAGNIPGKTQIVPLIIMTKLEQYKYSDAACIAIVLLLLSLLVLFVSNSIRKHYGKRTQIET